MVTECGHEEIKQYMLIYFVVDTCGGMVGEKMGMLNHAIQSLIPDINDMSEEYGISTYIKVMGYGSNAYWVNEDPVEVSAFLWKDLNASGLVEMGCAFTLLASDFERIKAHGKNFHPVIVWFSYRQPTDNCLVGLQKLKEQKWFKKTVRIAVAIGDEVDIDVLKEFTGNTEAILQAKDTRYLLKMLRPYDDDCYFEPEDYDYVSSFWDLYTKEKSNSILSAIPGRTDGCVCEEDGSVRDFSDIYDKSGIEGSYLRKMMVLYPSVLEEPKRFKALLLDYLPDDRMRRNLLYLSLEERIPMESVAAKTITNFEKTSWTKRLVDGYGCNVDIAREIVEQWLEALDRKINEVQSGTSENGNKIMGLAISELDLSPRSYNALRRAGINSISDLLNYGREAMGVRNLGRKALEEVLERLKELGIKLEPAENGGVSNPGKEKCNKLREIRIKIARANGIKYKPAVCNHQGPCAGTCPACDEEIRYIDEMLQKKRERGETIDLVGIAEREVAEAGIDPEIDEDIVMGTVPVLILEDDTEVW